MNSQVEKNNVQDDYVNSWKELNHETKLEKIGDFLTDIQVDFGYRNESSILNRITFTHIQKIKIGLLINLLEDILKDLDRNRELEM